MNQPTPPATVPPSTPSAATPAPPRSKRGCLIYGCGTLVALALIIAATVAITIWWIQRPIKPVVLTQKEKAVVDEKLRYVDGNRNDADATSVTARKPGADTGLTTGAPRTESDRTYVPGGKTIKLTEREINGLLNANTDLGKSVRIEFGRDAVNAYLVIPIPQDFPIGGGKNFRARGRFALSVGDGEPFATLEDVTVLGVSLPKDWLGGLKGQNLLGESIGTRGGRRTLRGIKSLHVEPGALVLEVED
jgi:hypothetical protein